MLIDYDVTSQVEIPAVVTYAVKRTANMERANAEL